MYRPSLLSLALFLSTLTKLFVLFVTLIWRDEYLENASVQLPAEFSRRLEYALGILDSYGNLGLGPEMPTTVIIRQSLGCLSALMGISGRHEVVMARACYF
jgi:hypothetical protein